jgi:hypothetical protein
MDLAAGETGPIRSFLKGKIQVKKLWHVFTLLKFIRIFIPALKIAGGRAQNFKNN